MSNGDKAPFNPYAFPKPGSNYESGEQDGMSLRDYFATHILQALITKQPLWDKENDIVPPEGIETWRQHTCESAYAYADAMLKARGA